MRLPHVTKITLFWVLLLNLELCLAQGTRLLRQPDISSTHITFTYGSDVWVAELNTNQARRITATAAVESDPHFSPDGQWIAFTSNRAGSNAVYVVSVNGGDAKRLTWHPSPALVRGWSNDGKRIIYASNRETAPGSYYRLWSIPSQGGVSELLTQQWSFDGAYSPDGKSMAIDKMSRWDVEWRAYRGGQNTPLILLDLKTSKEELIPNDKTTDTQPLWLDETVYFLSDRDFTTNIWAYNTKTKALSQITHYKGTDIKWLSGNNSALVFEREGYLHLFNLAAKSAKQLDINVSGDFPWAATKWEDVTSAARSASLSPNGKRVIMESRGDIFTVPVEFGNTRNITESSGVADRAPLWSPKGDKVAWFSDANQKEYTLMLSSQDGMTKPEVISIGESKMAWNPVWSPNGKYIAFVDNKVRMRVIHLETKAVQTIDVGGINIERTAIQLRWSPDSKWIAYAKTGSNMFRQVYVWSMKDNKATPITDSFADSFSPSWDLNLKQLYLLASTEVALGSGWANTSSMTSKPEYAAYVINLKKDDASPFKPKSDEEAVTVPSANSGDKKTEDSKKAETAKPETDKADTNKPANPKADTTKAIVIDFEGINRRILPLGMPVRNYQYTLTGAEGSVFIAESIENKPGVTVHKFTLKDKKAAEFITGASQVSVTANGKHLLAKLPDGWKLIGTEAAGDKGKTIKVSLSTKLDRTAEWNQLFEEAWRYERDYFYDPNIHGRDWNEVYKRYSPLVPYIKHRADLTYVLDQVNGELSVGHSFVFGGDMPETDKSQVGLLGADFEIENNRWKIKRIYTSENWNPELSGPLDQPGLKIKEGYYIVGINGKELTGNQDIYEFLDGTLGKQTLLHINDKPVFEGAWKETVEPIANESALRQRTWVEDNKRLVDKLSNGRLGYVWVPNTGGGGFVSFNRYYFAQQDKEGAVIDERFNGGGLLDDYMVDLMTRSLRAGLTNEVPNGTTFKLPAGILGPKVLLINELAGSGGDFFPWVFRQQKAGTLIGATTWGGLVKSSVHYSLIDGGALTAPDNAVFDPIHNQWIAENVGIAPDITVRQDAVSLSQGKDPQLERAVAELLKTLGNQPKKAVVPPPFSTPARKQ
ncbi:MAG: PDZ domain-containing protein [Spirosomataceae bacterium]